MKLLFKSLLIITLGLVILNLNSMMAQTTITLQPNSVEGKDAHVNSNFPTTNTGNNQGLYSAGWTWSGSYGTVRSFFQFDLLQIPTNAVIISANLTLFNDPVNNLILTDGEHASLTASNSSLISRVTEPWEESEINWNNQPNYNTIDQVSLPESTDPHQDYTDIDVRDMVQIMTSNPTENNGFVLRLQTEINYAALIFASSDDEDATNHPKLEITYFQQVGIDELTPDLVENIYPNPTNGDINIDFIQFIPHSTITIFNCLGQEVMTEEFGPTDKVNMWLDASKGIYFLRISIDSEEKTYKIFKD